MQTDVAATYRRLGMPVLLPAFLYASAQQAVLLLLPLYVLALGGSPAMAAATVGARGLGLLLFDLPAGQLVARCGERRVMVAGAAGTALSFCALAFSGGVIATAVAAFALGACNAAWMVARLSYVTHACTAEERGRVLALMAGLLRAGTLAGTAAGGLLAAARGFPVTFLCAALASAAAFLLAQATAHGGEQGRAPVPLRRMIRLPGVDRRQVTLAGAVSLSLLMLRAGRQLFVPLCGHAAGLGPAVIGLLYALSAALDALLFYPAGRIMDHLGRKWVIVPSLLALVLGLWLLAGAHSFYPFLLAVLVLGFGNGISSGFFMAIGSDLAPARMRAEFLGLWRLIGDAGFVATPLLAGIAIQLLGLAPAALAVAAAGMAGALAGLRMRETLPS